jgi:Trp operon repressor
MNKKLIIVGIIIAVIVIPIGVYTASPLFISTEVDEPVPISAVRSEAYQKFVSMNEEEKMQAAKQMTSEERDQIMATSATVNNSINESMNQVQLQQQPAQNTTTTTTAKNSLRSGSFVGVNDGIHNAEGIAKVIPLQQGSNILRLENFKATNGPDLYVYLGTDKSASDFVSLGRLKGNIGNQNYDIPGGTDLSKYNTVLIWCKAFSVLFGSAQLTMT